MKHNKKITIIILIMFLIAQFIGLYVVNTYAQEKVVNGEIVNSTGKGLPYGMEFDMNDENIDSASILISFLISLIIAVSLIFLLIKINARFIMRTWFFVVSTIALGISFTAVLPEIKYASIIGLAIAVPLVILKFYRQNFIAHNLTELLIYPGIATVFVPILSLTAVIILLLIISGYDMWAVWKSKIMQKMAKFQMEKLNVFGGFFIPYASKKTKEKIKILRGKFRSKKKLEKELKKSRLKINLAILGGGDIVYPIITSGVILKTWGLAPAILVITGATLGLTILLFLGKKKVMYPAMPFISAGIILALIISYLFLI
ncbi:hypothetical protein J4411_01070 [Candidatus Pacearchaeota archaeon]|nr:hypothetical protein [Candidatus Pacearchaeota archaeon]